MNKSKIVIMGRENAGKTSVANNILGEILLFVDKSKSTIIPSLLINGETNVTAEKKQKR